MAFSVVLSRLWNGQRDRCLLCWVKRGGVMFQWWGGMMRVVTVIFAVAEQVMCGS